MSIVIFACGMLLILLGIIVERIGQVLRFYRIMAMRGASGGNGGKALWCCVKRCKPLIPLGYSARVSSSVRAVGGDGWGVV